MTLRWTDRAVDDLEDIADRAPRAAAHVYEAIVWLGRMPFPKAFRQYEDSGTERILSVAPYIVVYRVVDEDIVVLRVADARRFGARW